MVSWYWKCFLSLEASSIIILFLFSFVNSRIQIWERFQVEWRGCHFAVCIVGSLRVWELSIVLFQGPKLKVIILPVGGDLELHPHHRRAKRQQRKMWHSISMLQQQGFRYSPQFKPKFPHDVKRLKETDLVQSFVCLCGTFGKNHVCFHSILRKEKNYDDAHCSNIWDTSDHVYGNMEVYKVFLIHSFINSMH